MLKKKMTPRQIHKLHNRKVIQALRREEAKGSIHPYNAAAQIAGRNKWIRIAESMQPA